jgi:hypothetical protein
MQTRLGTGLLLAALLLLPLSSTRADPVDPTPVFIAELQNAIRNDDKAWLADHLHFPVNYFGKTDHIIKSKDWFLRHYATLIGPELKKNILAQKPENYFKNYQGVMVGDGGLNIWVEDFGDEGAGIPARFEIITINNSPPDRHPATK